ncbi:MAG: M48 family metallopeptidase [Polyangiales bacterium]
MDCSATTHFLEAIRFAEERACFEALGTRPELDAQRAQQLQESHRRSVRKRLLASAVRVDARMLPKLDASIRAVQERAHFTEAMEAYVFEDAAINAFVTPGKKHTYLGLSSGAVGALSEQELEFVIGHELGHALLGHTRSALASELQSEGLANHLRRELLAYKRACEVSADRCGLVCCASIDVAATAMFRTLSGLAVPGLSVHPDDFSEQWDHLLAEVIEGGADDMWQNTHPFPPMRMKALVLFWQSSTDLLPAERERKDMPLSEVDAQISRLLATLDPQVRARHGAADPLLEDVLLWAGLAVAHAGGAVRSDIIERLRQLVPMAVAAHLTGAELSEADCLAHLKASLELRQKRLKAAEVYRILSAVLNLAPLAEKQEHPCGASFDQVASAFGIDTNGCAVVRERHAAQSKL